MRRFQATVFIDIDDSQEDQPVTAAAVSDPLEEILEDDVIIFTFQDHGLPSPSITLQRVEEIPLQTSANRGSGSE